ncbi:MAG: HAD family hydrolase [Ruminococcaceae bacterium]|nr:HAD family hydrolase [Oscillospiraceae bacterium]
MIKGAIFDLDGTLLATLESIAKAGNTMLKHFGYPPVPVKQYGIFAGNGADKLVERALIYSGDTKLVHLEEAIRVYREIFGEYCSYQVKPYDGIVKMLDELVAKKIHLGVVTNKPHVSATRLMKEYFGNYPFTHVIGQQTGLPQKPDPAGIFTLLSDWGIAPSECVYLGDSDVDMQTGNNAGCLTIGVLWGFRDKGELDENGAHHTIENPLELLDLLK